MQDATNETTGAVEATAPRQSVATAAEAGLPITKSEYEVKLEKQVKGLQLSISREKAGRLDAEKSLKQVREEFEAYKLANPEQQAQATDEQEEAEQADEHAETRELLQRYGLKKAYLVNGETYFDENAALAAAGDNADSITEILPE